MKINKLITSPKGYLLADIGAGLYIGQVSSMELAICKKVKKGYEVIKTVLAGFMMREHKDFVRAIEILKEKDLPGPEPKPASDKKRFGFTLEYVFHTCVEVEADSVREAIEKVKEMSVEEIVGNDVIAVTSLEDGQPVSAWDEQGNDLTEEAGI